MMAWPDVLTRRRLALANLIQARAHSVVAGDRSVVQVIDGVIDRQRDRVRYADKMASLYPRLSTPVNAQFATSDNRPDNQAGSGADNA